MRVCACVHVCVGHEFHSHHVSPTCAKSPLISSTLCTALMSGSSARYVPCATAAAAAHASTTQAGFMNGSPYGQPQPRPAPGLGHASARASSPYGQSLTRPVSASGHASARASSARAAGGRAGAYTRSRFSST
jgi:hypothetical protein